MTALTVGLHPDIPDDVYHADRASLSSSGARALLPPSCPALFRWSQDHGDPPKKAFDFGHVAHRLVLGKGADIAVIKADDWRKNATKEEADLARAAGQTPILEKTFKTAKRMAEQIERHPVASALFQSGAAEQTIVWRDEVTKVLCRARPDWLTENDGRAVSVDYKTSDSVEPRALARSFAKFGYHQQDDWYLDGLRSLGHDDPAFLFVCQEKTPPYLISIVQLDHRARTIAAAKNHAARTIYARCTETGIWPGYSGDSIELLSLPGWADKEYDPT